jgi:hypothetical protein
MCVIAGGLLSSVPPVCPVQMQLRKFEQCPYCLQQKKKAAGPRKPEYALIDIMSFFLPIMLVALNKKQQKKPTRMANQIYYYIHIKAGFQ